MKPIKSLIAAVSALTLCITPFALNNAPAATVSYAASSTAGTANTLSSLTTTLSLTSQDADTAAEPDLQQAAPAGLLLTAETL